MTTETFEERMGRIERERRERLTPPPLDERKHPEPGQKCLECALGFSFYVPCGKPAEFIIENRDERVPMCPMCADHNVRNRGAKYGRLDNPETGFSGMIPL